jgi:hypothetical protein
VPWKGEARDIGRKQVGRGKGQNIEEKEAGISKRPFELMLDL